MFRKRYNKLYFSRVCFRIRYNINDKRAIFERLLLLELQLLIKIFLILLAIRKISLDYMPAGISVPAKHENIHIFVYFESLFDSSGAK